MVVNPIKIPNSKKAITYQSQKSLFEGTFVVNSLLENKSLSQAPIGLSMCKVPQMVTLESTKLPKTLITSTKA